MADIETDYLVGDNWCPRHDFVSIVATSPRQAASRYLADCAEVYDQMSIIVYENPWEVEEASHTFPVKWGRLAA